jgi:tetratricopeptide (TPR) repeat protein
MSDSTVKGALRQNWYLVVVMGICVVAAAYGFAVSGGEANGEDVKQPAFGAQAVPMGGSGPDRLEQLNRASGSSRDKVMQTIQSHREKVDAEPEAEDAPALLAAMGNLYRQKLRDYEQAALCYEELLSNHRDWEASRRIYLQLATCYERLENWPSAYRVYTEMAATFPEESQEYEYAQAKLRGRIPVQR